MAFVSNSILILQKERSLVFSNVQILGSVTSVNHYHTMVVQIIMSMVSS